MLKQLLEKAELPPEPEDPMDPYIAERISMEAGESYLPVKAL